MIFVRISTCCGMTRYLHSTYYSCYPDPRYLLHFASRNLATSSDPPASSSSPTPPVVPPSTSPTPNSAPTNGTTTTTKPSSSAPSGHAPPGSAHHLPPGAPPSSHHHHHHHHHHPANPLPPTHHPNNVRPQPPTAAPAAGNAHHPVNPTPIIAPPPIPFGSRDLIHKMKTLRSQLNAMQPPTGHCRIEVSRRNVFEDSYRTIMKIRARDLKKKLHIKFQGEDGLDYGGIAREWLYLLSHEMLNPIYGLFQYSRDDVYTLQINPDSAINPVSGKGVGLN